MAKVNPALLAKVKSLKLRVRGLVEGFLVGYHRSPFKGFSTEFSEHRAYVPGDDPRWIDWRATARSGSLKVKVFEEETNLVAYIALDASASADWAWETRVNLAGALAYLLHLQRDAFGLLVFDEKIRLFIKPGSGRVHLDEVLKTLARLEPSGKTRPEALLELAGLMRRTGLAAVISDMMFEPARLEAPLRALRWRKHEVLGLQVLPREAARPPRKPGLYVDAETGERVRYHPAQAAEAFRENLGRWLSEVKGLFLRLGAGYALVREDADLFKALAAFLEARGRRP